VDRRRAFFLLYIDAVMVMAGYHGLSKRHSGLTLMICCIEENISRTYDA